MSHNPFEVISDQLNRIENKIGYIDTFIQRSVSTNGDPAPTWFNIDQLCEYLPDKPKKATIYGYVHSMAIPVHKRSRRLAFLKSEIDDWIKQGRRKTLDEISQESIFKKKGTAA